MKKRYLIQHFPEEHYSILFDSRSGFFARMEDVGYPEPHWSQHGPELIDISITRWCDFGCSRCYRNANPDGTHMTLAVYENLIQQAARLGTLQVALGGGNPNQHPDFCRILQLTRQKYGIIPSYTTNGRGLTEDILKATKENCGAIAVSAYFPYLETASAVVTCVEFGIKTNLHFVISDASLPEALHFLTEPPSWTAGLNAIIFLNYKPVGRLSAEKPLRESPLLPQFWSLLNEPYQPFRIGFDSCMVSGIAVNLPNVNPSLYEACEASRFSMFVSEQNLAYPCSFMEPLVPGISLFDHTLQDIWQNSPLFQQTRQNITPEKCPCCPFRRHCLGGCPILDTIQVCRQK